MIKDISSAELQKYNLNLKATQDKRKVCCPNIRYKQMAEQNMCPTGLLKI